MRECVEVSICITYRILFHGFLPPPCPCIVCECVLWTCVVFSPSLVVISCLRSCVLRFNAPFQCCREFRTPSVVCPPAPPSPTITSTTKPNKQTNSPCCTPGPLPHPQFPHPPPLDSLQRTANASPAPRKRTTIRAENVAHNAAVREGERLRRAPSVSAVRQDRLQRAQPLLRALSRQVHVPLLHGRVHAQRHAADARALQASGVLLDPEYFLAGLGRRRWGAECVRQCETECAGGQPTD